MSAVLQPRLNLTSYLEWENAQAERHEFVQGELLAMTGGRRTHARVISNLNRRLAEGLEGTPCQVFAESMKVQVAEDTVLHPDLVVTCDTADLEAEHIFRAPTLILEVLSPSTQACDRSKKFALHRLLHSLQEYTLVDPDTRRVEAFRRTAQNQWVLHDMSDGDWLEAPSVGLRVLLAEVLWGMEPPAAEPVAAPLAEPLAEPLAAPAAAAQPPAGN